MYQTPPHAATRQRVEDRVSCPTCGSACKTVWRRGPDRRLHEVIVCENEHFVRFAPRRKPSAEQTLTGKFLGWHRAAKGSPWQAVVVAETEDDAWNQLLDLPASNGDKVVLSSDRRPDERPRRRFCPNTMRRGNAE